REDVPAAAGFGGMEEPHGFIAGGKLRGADFDPIAEGFTKGVVLVANFPRDGTERQSEVFLRFEEEQRREGRLAVFKSQSTQIGLCRDGVGKVFRKLQQVESEDLKRGHLGELLAHFAINPARMEGKFLDFRKNTSNFLEPLGGKIDIRSESQGATVIAEFA